MSGAVLASVEKGSVSRRMAVGMLTKVPRLKIPKNFNFSRRQSSALRLLRRRDHWGAPLISSELIVTDDYIAASETAEESTYSRKRRKTRPAHVRYFERVLALDIFHQATLQEPQGVRLREMRILRA
jgi:hypothetical protein